MTIVRAGNRYMLQIMNDAPPSTIDFTAITFDIDWAPDWAIEDCARLCLDHGTPATFFVTHDSPAIRQLSQEPLFELGIHPNFLPDSTHGTTTEDVLNHCLNIVPTACAMRSHALVQSTTMFECIADNFPSLTIDVSILLPGHANLQPVEMPFGLSGRLITRLPYYWEDDVAALDKRWQWGAPIPRLPGLKIAAFHPIHVALNTNNLATYNKMRKLMSYRNLADISVADIEPFVNPGDGTRTLLNNTLADNYNNEFATVSEIAHFLPR